MSRYDTYHATPIDPPVMRRWFMVALILSLALHGGLFYYFTRARVDGFVFKEENLAPARVFHMKRVTIPEAPPEEKRLTIPENVPNTTRLTIPSDKPVLEEVHVAPQISELSKQIFNEKPRVDMTNIDRMTRAEATSRQQMDKELNSIAQGLVTETPRMPNQPRIRVGGGRPGAGEGDANVSIPGLASVDDMLAKTGPLQSGEKAAMPGGALFEYDQYALLPQAVAALQQLGILIQKNPKATFSIEGHSDSFGSPEYNVKLSEKRAEAVKQWLVANMGIAPARIQTRGLGNSKPLVPSDRSVEEQAPNRRVEIVVRTNRG